MTTSIRRVITGLDADGRSCVIIDGPSDALAWSTAETPVDNSGTEDKGGPFTFDMPRGGTRFGWTEFPPAPGVLFGIGMHATNTIDYFVVLKGEVVLVLEKGEVLCRPGDLIVDRGVMHGWRNDGTESCLLAAVVVDAAPVGAGATI